MGLKDRMKRADPLGKMLGTRPDTNIRQFVATGAAAGDVVVTGLKIGDKIISVVYRLTVAGNLVDMTSAFGSGGSGDKRGNGAVLTRNDVINNTGGATTAAGQIIVLVESFDVR
jgi:hypothetical protein